MKFIRYKNFKPVQLNTIITVEPVNNLLNCLKTNVFVEIKFLCMNHTVVWDFVPDFLTHREDFIVYQEERDKVYKKILEIIESNREYIDIEKLNVNDLKVLDFVWIKFNIPFRINHGTIQSEVISDLYQFVEIIDKYENCGSDLVWPLRKNEPCIKVKRIGEDNDVIFVNDIIEMKRIVNPFDKENNNFEIL